MAKNAESKIRRELNEFIKSNDAAQCGIRVELLNDHFNELKGEIKGPSDTPYEGGIFDLEIKIPKEYPFKPPNVRFLTKIWHPNISSVTGAICLDILKDTWTPALSLRSVLLSIQVLLSAAEPDDPQDAVVAKQFKNHPNMFKLTARHWTSAYAGGSKKHKKFDDQIKTLLEMGLNEVQSRSALSSCNWDLEITLDELFS